MSEEKQKAWTSAKQRAAERAWHDKNIKKLQVHFNVVNDADILAKLDAQTSKIDYLRRLIREDIARENEQK